MKDRTKKQLEASRPNVDTLDAITFCLDRLYADQNTKTSDEVVKGLIFEELLGALLAARDLAQPLNDDE